MPKPHDRLISSTKSAATSALHKRIDAIQLELAQRKGRIDECRARAVQEFGTDDVSKLCALMDETATRLEQLKQELETALADYQSTYSGN